MNPTTTIPLSTPTPLASLSDPLPTDHKHRDSQRPRVGGQLLPGGQSALATHNRPAAGDLLATDHQGCDAQSVRVGGEPSPVVESPAPPTAVPKTKRQAAGGWLELRIWAEMLHDAQLARIAAVNRAERGGVDAGVYAAHVAQMESVEHACALALRRSFRRVAPPELVAWQKAEKGVGEHLLARLLGHLGDPLIATPHRWMERPPEGHICDPARCGATRHLVGFEPSERSVSQLWAYCGHGDPNRRKFKGMTADDAMGLGSPGCKMLLWNLSVACMKQQPGAKFRDVYEARRVTTVERVHAAPCVRCGPSGKPAAEGSPWSKAHQHADALRIVGKELLRDLWTLRKAASQQFGDTHLPIAGGELERKAS